MCVDSQKKEKKKEKNFIHSVELLPQVRDKENLIDKHYYFKSSPRSGSFKSVHKLNHVYG